MKVLKMAKFLFGALVGGLVVLFVSVMMVISKAFEGLTARKNKHSKETENTPDE